MNAHSEHHAPRRSYPSKGRIRVDAARVVAARQGCELLQHEAAALFDCGRSTWQRYERHGGAGARLEAMVRGLERLRRAGQYGRLRWWWALGWYPEALEAESAVLGRRRRDQSPCGPAVAGAAVVLLADGTLDIQIPGSKPGSNIQPRQEVPDKAP